jgi:hypothetical protein
VGLAKKILGGIERKLDGPPKPPPLSWPADQPWARLLTSERNPRNVGDPNQSGAPGILDDLIGKAAGVPYRFELEVHRPDQATYTLLREERVPTKVEGILFLESHSIPAGAEVPLEVKGPGSEDVELDWGAYLAVSDQKDRAYHQRIDAQRSLKARLDAEGKKR